MVCGRLSFSALVACPSTYTRCSNILLIIPGANFLFHESYTHSPFIVMAEPPVFWTSTTRHFLSGVHIGLVRILISGLLDFQEYMVETICQVREPAARIKRQELWTCHERSIAREVCQGIALPSDTIVTATRAPPGRQQGAQAPLRPSSAETRQPRLAL